MLVTIRDDVTSCASAFRSLDQIFLRIEAGAHDWQIDDVDALFTSTWLANRNDYREYVENLVKANAYPKPIRFSRQLVVCATPQPNARPTELVPEAAAQFVSKPLLVLMENKFTDGTLFDIAVEFLAPPDIAHNLTERKVGMIEYLSAGGLGEIPKHIQDRKREAADLCIPLRLLVFTDSDGLTPGARDAPAQTVADQCAKSGIPCCILGKRTIENYIPDEVFDAWLEDPNNTGMKGKIALLQEFTSEQRDHFSIKKGFGGQKPILHDDNLYTTLPDETRKQWQRGLGDEVIYLLTKHKAALSAEALKARDHTGDLAKLITLLLAEL